MQRLKRKQKKPKQTRGRFNVGTPISKRPAGAFQSFTTDRGKEFSCYTTVEADLTIPVYFADPYSAWQRGSNENSTELLREFFPKGANFDKVQSYEVQGALQLMNNRPRKCLGWKTPHEVFRKRLLHLI